MAVPLSSVDEALLPGHMCYLLEYEPPSKEADSPSRDKRIANLATFRDQAHSPLIQYEYVAVDVKGHGQDNGTHIDEARVSHIVLAYMPSSVPPAADLTLTIHGNGSTKTTHSIASHDWRRLQEVDLDDAVAQYGIGAASTRLSDRMDHKTREQFRYGEKGMTTTTDCLARHLGQNLDSFVARGRAWHKHGTQAQGRVQQTLQTQLPLSPNSWRAPSIFDLGAPAIETEKRPSPHNKPWQQIVSRKGPSMRLYLANVQGDIERRMLQQYKIQSLLYPEAWAGSQDQQNFERLMKRRELFRQDLVDMKHSRKSVNDSWTTSETTAPSKGHSKATSPPIGKQNRRILVVWGATNNRPTLDRLAPGFLQQFHGWVDLQEVATPLLLAASGCRFGQNKTTMPLLDALRVVGFRPGYSLQSRSRAVDDGASRDPGMDAVRTLGVLARIVAYPAGIFSQLEKETRDTLNRHYRQHGFYLSESVYPCAIFLFTGIANCPNAANAQSMLKLLRDHGLAEPVILAAGGERRPTRLKQNQICMYYDTMQQINAAVAALNGFMVGGVRLQATLLWHPDPAWHCAYSQVSTTQTVPPRDTTLEIEASEEAQK
ncbi:uncharacterized protein SPSK_08771 [Sporothrix schenckii 1099-18]|uniref:Uncharacterized protein n=1 Tax=Sporothrix schenckii 1099-18 TaxID=1397361 RepID=A0A0F2MA79_SPOSC|nr:uncharacterized protein SPSK_08771 [Sporothrix schenckii 1099-18]KJR85979.1 hypothetical protein SPSK_08771 [Sporothrix schenckii 1099-18]